MTEDRPTRASHAPCAPQGPMGDPESGRTDMGPSAARTERRDRIADRLHTAMHDYDLDIAKDLADVVMPDVQAEIDPLADVTAHAVVLAAGINPRDLQRARRGLHRRMYVPADRLIALIDALEKCCPGAIAEVRAEEETDHA